MRALIVGGGVAGPATALALQAVGIDSVVLEARRPEELGQGSYLTLAPNGVHALGELGLLEPARGIGFPSRTNVMVGATGRVLGTVTLGRPLPDGTPALTCRRAALAAAAGGRGGAPRAPRSGTAPASSASRSTRSASRSCSRRRSRLAGDLLVGADGVRSRIAPDHRPGRAGRALRRADELRRAHPGTPRWPPTWRPRRGTSSSAGARSSARTRTRRRRGLVRQRPACADRRRRAGRTSSAQWQAWLVGLLADDAGPGRGPGRGR